MNIITDKIISSNNPNVILEYAVFDNMDKKRIEDKIISFKNPDYIVKLARCNGVNKERLESELIKLNDAKSIYMYMALVTESSVLLVNALYKTRNKEYIMQYKNNITRLKNGKLINNNDSIDVNLPLIVGANDTKVLEKNKNKIRKYYNI